MMNISKTEKSGNFLCGVYALWIRKFFHINRAMYASLSILGVAKLTLPDNGMSVFFPFYSQVSLRGKTH